jgi:hypothetical protein
MGHLLGEGRRARLRNRLALAFAAMVLAICALGPSAPAARAQAGTPTDSADGMIFWLSCDRIAQLTDAQLDEWKSRGVDGFVCMAGHLRNMGGTQDFTGDPTNLLTGSNYALQRQLRDSNIVGRANARGMKMYLGAKLVNYYNRATPLSDWFDDAGWSQTVLPKISDLAGAAKLLGFAGVAFDQELYPQVGNVEEATWDWNYPGNTHTEAEVRAEARDRGEQVMSAILGAFPGAELIAYDVQFPETWEAEVQDVVNDEQDAYAARLDINFWNGMTSVDGYGAIRLVDAIFYKSPHIGTWDSALQYNANRLAALLSKQFSNWDYASSRVYLSPFSWIDPGPSSSEFDDAHSPDYVRDQLLAFRKWGMGGEFANYVYDQNLQTFDYTPYVSAMQEASTPAVVDSEPPTLAVTQSDGAPGSAGTIAGTAHDNLAVWAVRWQDDLGRSGVAQLSWDTGNDDDNFKSESPAQTRWSIPASELTPGASRVTITAADIKGLESAPTTIPAVDLRPPKTEILTRHHARLTHRLVRFRFRADEHHVQFECKMDRGAWRSCNHRHASYRLGHGRHRFMVRAIDQAGNRDRTPAHMRFVIKRRA